MDDHLWRWGACRLAVAALVGLTVSFGCDASGDEAAADDTAVEDAAAIDTAGPADGAGLDAAGPDVAGPADGGGAPPDVADAGDGGAPLDVAVAPSCGGGCAAAGRPCPPDQRCDEASGRCVCRASCGVDDECEPGRRCLAGPCGCVTCVDYLQRPGFPCPDGLETVLVPPPDDHHFGTNACAPPLCDGAACYTDYDCADGTRCAGDDVATARQGRCTPAVEPPACFDDDDCPEGAACEGAVVCPPCRPCGAAPTAGACVPAAGGPAVFLHVREEAWGYFSPGPIAAQWVNLGAAPVALPACEAVVVEGYGGQDDPWMVVEEGGFPICDPPALAAAPAVVLAPGATRAVDGLVILCACNPDGAIRVRLRGRYGVGCPADEPFDPARCTSGALEATSPSFFVSIPY